MGITNLQHNKCFEKVFNVHRLFNRLIMVKKVIDNIISKDFDNDLELREFVNRRFRTAMKILPELRIRLRGIAVHGVEGFRISFLSSETMEKGFPTYHLVKNLTGDIVRIPSGVSIDRSIHVVEISKWRFKCSCPDALYTTAIADRKLLRVYSIREPIFYRYCLCKHVILGLAILYSKNYIDIQDRDLVETIWLSVYACYLRLLDRDRLSRSRYLVKKAFDILRRRSIAI